MPNMGPAGDTRGGPSVERMQRVGMDDVDVEATDQPDEPCHRERPRRDVAEPFSRAVTGRESMHRHLVHRSTGGDECCLERRAAGHGDVEVKLVAWEAPYEP